MGWLREAVERQRSRRRVRTRLASYAGGRERYWCSPYCALSFSTALWRSRHRAGCAGYQRYHWEREHHYHRYGSEA